MGLVSARTGAFAALVWLTACGSPIPAGGVYLGDDGALLFEDGGAVMGDSILLRDTAVAPADASTPDALPGWLLDAADDALDAADGAADDAVNVVASDADVGETDAGDALDAAGIDATGMWSTRILARNTRTNRGAATSCAP